MSDLAFTNDAAGHHPSLFSPQGISNILIGLVLFTVFVSVFYFTYAAAVEGQVVTKQVNILVDSLVGDIGSFGVTIPPLVAPDMSAEDLQVKQNNDALLAQATTTVGIFVGVVALVVVGLWAFQKYYIGGEFDVLSIGLSNLVLIVFVGLTEYFYLTFISGNYQSMNPNAVKANILKNIVNF